MVFNSYRVRSHFEKQRAKRNRFHVYYLCIAMTNTYSKWLPRFCSPLEMPQKSRTKLNWHIIPFSHVYRGGTHRTCNTCGLCRKTDPVCSKASCRNFPPHKAWLPLYTPTSNTTFDSTTSVGEHLSRECFTRAPDSREYLFKFVSSRQNLEISLQKRFFSMSKKGGTKLSWYIIFGTKSG